MTTHELLGEDCMSFADLYSKKKGSRWGRDLDALQMAHTFLTQPLTPEWMEKYVEGFRWVGMDVFAYKKDKITYFLSTGCWYTDDLIFPKNVSHFFDSLPPEIKLKYKNADI